ncbi:MAG: DUF3892 domain-containing protein [Oscillospiraceae bacterium]|nr:DUF3892 domain-containing protein [Oscillospiraceae bacterium]
MNNNDHTHTLPKNALRDIPTPNSDAKEIVALLKDNGRVVGYKLSDGQVLQKEEAVAYAKSGGIKGVGVAARNDEEYLKSIPDGTEDNNLSHLPTVSE